MTVGSTDAVELPFTNWQARTATELRCSCRTRTVTHPEVVAELVEMAF
jgi:hypothetical protein